MLEHLNEKNCGNSNLRVGRGLVLFLNSNFSFFC